MQLSADISPDDYRNYIAFLDERDTQVEDSEVRARDSAGERVLVLLAVVAFVGFVGHLLYSKGLDHWIQHPIYLTILIIGLLFACLGLGASLEERAMRRRGDGDRLDQSAVREGFNLGEVHFDLRPEGLGVTFALVQDLYSWQGFQAIGEGPEAFYLMSPYGQAVIVPKRAFADEAARERFKDLAVSFIGGRE